MKHRIPITTVSIALSLATAHVFAEPVGAVFPGNEAVRIVNGKRVVEAPPLTKGAQRFLKAGNKLPPPTSSTTVFMVEGPNGLMECSSGALTDSSCAAPSIGKTKHSRFWTVKLNGSWLHCPSRVPSKNCEAAEVGMPGGIGAVE